MRSRIVSRWKKLGHNAHVRLCLVGLGWLLMAVSPLAGLLPGPGGIFVFAFGLGLVLKNSAWARRRYVALKRRWPRHGRWADWGLRRQSARRRAAIEKARQSAAD